MSVHCYLNLCSPDQQGQTSSTLLYLSAISHKLTHTVCDSIEDMLLLAIVLQVLSTYCRNKSFNYLYSEYFLPGSHLGWVYATSPCGL